MMALRFGPGYSLGCYGADKVCFLQKKTYAIGPTSQKVWPRDSKAHGELPALSAFVLRIRGAALIN